MAEPPEKKQKLADEEEAVAAAADAENEEATKKEEPPKELEEDAKKDSSAKIKDSVKFLTPDMSMNVLLSSAGNGYVLASLNEGNLSNFVACARANVGIKSGRYMFELRVIEASSHSKSMLRIGFAAEGTLFLGEEENSLCFEGDGHVVENKNKKWCSGYFGRDNIVGVVLNLDADSPNFNTISLFVDGMRASPPQTLPDAMKDVPLFPTVAFKGATVHVNFAAPVSELPFKCRSVQEASAKDVDVKKFDAPADGKYNVLFPVCMPDEGTYDWCDAFLEKNPDYTELSDRVLVEWGRKSGALSVKRKTSNDKPDDHLPSSTLRRMLMQAASAQPRNLVVMDVKGNLTKEDRLAALGHVKSPAFKAVADVLVGDPPSSFKKTVHTKVLKAKQMAADLAFKAKKMDDKRKWELRKLSREVEKKKKKAEKERLKKIADARKKVEEANKKRMEDLAAAKKAAYEQWEQSQKPAEETTTETAKAVEDSTADDKKAEESLTEEKKAEDESATEEKKAADEDATEEKKAADENATEDKKDADESTVEDKKEAAETPAKDEEEVKKVEETKEETKVEEKKEEEKESVVAMEVEEKEEESEDDDVDDPEPMEEDPPQAELSVEEKAQRFMKHPVPDLTPYMLGMSFTKFSIPDKTEGFDAVKFSWSKEKESAEYFKNWIHEKKQTTCVEDIEPSAWFKEKLAKWSSELAAWKLAWNDYKRRIQKKALDKALKEKKKQDKEKKRQEALKAKEEAAKAKEEAAKAKEEALKKAKEEALKATEEAQNQMKTDEEGKEVAEEKKEEEKKEEEKKEEDKTEVEKQSTEEKDVPPPEEEEKEEEEEEEEVEEPEVEVDFDGVDIYGTSDVCDIGGGMPLFKDFQYEDFALMSLRFELHLLARSFAKDVNDPERTGIHSTHLAFYYQKYFNRGLSCQAFGVKTVEALIGLVKDTMHLSPKHSTIDSLVPAELESFAVFVKLTEHARRHRLLMLDMGDESMRLSISAPPEATPKQESPSQSAGEWQKSAGDWKKPAGEWQKSAGEWQKSAGEWQKSVGEWQKASSGEWQKSSGEWQKSAGEWQKSPSGEWQKSPAASGKGGKDYGSYGGGKDYGGGKGMKGKAKAMMEMMQAAMTGMHNANSEGWDGASGEVPWAP